MMKAIPRILISTALWVAHASAESCNFCSGSNFVLAYYETCSDAPPDEIICSGNFGGVFDDDANQVSSSDVDSAFVTDSCSTYSNGAYLAGDNGAVTNLYINGLWYGCVFSDETCILTDGLTNDYYNGQYCCANSGIDGADCPASGCGDPC